MWFTGLLPSATPSKGNKILGCYLYLKLSYTQKAKLIQFSGQIDVN